MSSTFERPDWTLFRSLQTLPQKAGVRKELLAMLVAKEATDNSLDAAGACDIGLLPGQNGFYVQDKGPGIDPERLTDYFSMNRPMISTKQLRMPTRGALGNGLRVVTGAVVASGGQLFVCTRGRRYEIIDLPDGTARKNDLGAWPERGTRLEVILGDSLPFTKDDLNWSEWACQFATGEEPSCQTSAYWYSSDDFFEMLNAYTGRLGELLGHFEGLPQRKARTIVERFGNQFTARMAFEQSEAVLELLRDHTRRIPHKRLGRVGDGNVAEENYSSRCGTYVRAPGRGQFTAEVPFVVEVWYDLHDGPTANVVALVNKTHITGDLNVHHGENRVSLSGCGMGWWGFKSPPARIVINFHTPYMPITSDGKQPDLRPFRDELEAALNESARKAKRTANAEARTLAALKFNIQTDRPARITERDVILANLPAAIEKSSGGGPGLFSQRQLYYAIRPYVMEAFGGKQPDYNYFCTILTDYENDHGEIPNLYRDPRGTLYHPHLHEDIPVGTLSVRGYQMPPWTFKTVLYSEKEGFFEILKQAGFPERHDCALLTSKGFASRAVRDLIDMMGESDEEITFMSIHDADSAGGMIHQGLQEGTAARPGRRVRIINLGLEPWEGMDMSLQVETFDAPTSNGKRRVRPVAKYITDHANSRDNESGEDWTEWLQTNRIELNAMSTPQFLEWLEGKIAQYGPGKVVPPEEVMEKRLNDQVEDIARGKVQARILREADFEDQVTKALADLGPELEREASELTPWVRARLKVQPLWRWTQPVEEIALRVTERVK